ncbi:MAG TPA: hypothetical protein EYQ54_05360 [Myxococcales bacterium]|nr:hypothetical protein [Myxococcales bacterium]HIL81489.1 hypothetical protein [Myxococcales bacterium]
MENQNVRTAMEMPLVSWHLKIGWWGLLAFLSLGIVLEAMHGFKLGWYLDVSNHIRRLMLTLAHTHGALLSLVNLAFAATLFMRQAEETTSQRIASRSLACATILIPGGFFLGGLIIWGGDPGLGVVLVPLGACFLVVGVFLTARELAREK